MRVISIWTKPLLVESHASGTVSFHTPTSLSSMGPLDAAASENGNAHVSQAAERQMKPRIGKHSACEMWVSTATTVKGWLENFHRYLSSADNEILWGKYPTRDGPPLTMLLYFSKYPWGSPVLIESSPKSMSPLKQNSNHAYQPLESPRDACATGKWNSHPGGEPLIRTPFLLSHEIRFRPQMHFVPPDAALGCTQQWSAWPHPCPGPPPFPASSCPHSAPQSSSYSAWGVSCLRLCFLENPTKTSWFPWVRTLATNLITICWGHCLFEAIEDSSERKGLITHYGFEYWSHHLLAV